MLAFLKDSKSFLFLSSFVSFRCYERAVCEQMMDVETSYSEFINCDRTGRRNAVPDIKGEAVAAGTGELTKDMAQMDLKAAGTSHSFTSSRKAAAVLIFLQHCLLLLIQFCSSSSTPSSYSSFVSHSPLTATSLPKPHSLTTTSPPLTKPPYFSSSSFFSPSS